MSTEKNKEYFVQFSTKDNGYHRDIEIYRVYDSFEDAKREIISCNVLGVFSTSHTYDKIDYDKLDYDKYNEYEDYKPDDYSYIYHTHSADEYILSIKTDERYLHITADGDNPVNFDTSNDCKLRDDMKEDVSREDMDDDNEPSGIYIVYDLHKSKQVYNWNGWYNECYKKVERWDGLYDEYYDYEASDTEEQKIN